MKRRVILEAPVAEEMEQGYRWIARHSLGAAKKWYNGCLDAIESLDQFAERCPIAPENELFSEEIRHFIYGNYRIIFTVRGSAVHILHVRHGARRPVAPLKRRTRKPDRDI